LIWCSSVTGQELTQTQPPRNVQNPVFLTSWLLASNISSNKTGVFLRQFGDSEIIPSLPD
jgi:hypothetical protein